VAAVAVAMATEALGRIDPDPLGVIDAFFGSPAAEAVEPTYLAWLLTLTPALDPAQAAAQLLARPADAPRSMAGDRLLSLLRDTARWPRPAVAASAVRRRPHGGRA
jgi:hypothetical protein